MADYSSQSSSIIEEVDVTASDDVASATLLESASDNAEGNHRRLKQPPGPNEQQPLLAQSSIHTTSNESSEISISENQTDIVDGKILKYVVQEFVWLIKIASPIVVAQLLNLSLGIIGTFMLGHLGTKELAAGALSLLFCNVTGLSIGSGMASGLDLLCPQAFTGSDDPHAVGKHLQRGLVIMFILTIPISIIWAFTTPILKALGQDSELSAMAGYYAFAMMPSLFPYFVNECIRRYILAQGLSRSQAYIYGTSAPLSIFFQWFFVSALKLGFIGSPIATSISYTLLPILSILYIRYIEGSNCWGGWEWKEALDWRLLRQQAGYAVGGLLQLISEWWSFEIVALVAGLFGEVSLAVQSICMITAGMLFMIPMGIGSGALVRVGNCLGTGTQPNRARVATYASLLLALCTGILNCLFCVAVRNVWAFVWNSDPDVVKMTALILPLLAVFQVSDGLNAICVALLRALGKPLISALGNLIAYYVVGIPIGAALAFKADLGLFGMWIGLTVGLMSISCFVVPFILLATDWEKESIRARERVSELRPLLAISEETNEDV